MLGVRLRYLLMETLGNILLERMDYQVTGAVRSGIWSSIKLNIDDGILWPVREHTRRGIVSISFRGLEL